MVQLMLNGFGGDRRRQPPNLDSANAYGMECYHVNARLSKDLRDIGEFRLGKLGLLLFYCLQALWIRFRHGVENLYYVPAPGKYSALCRDWLVLGLCRPFFRRLILHGHAAGLGRWLETAARMPARVWTWRALGRADLFVVLSHHHRRDVEKFWPRRVAVVPNGIPDPCPAFETEVLPRRLARRAVREAIIQARLPDPEHVALAGPSPEEVRILFLGHCMKEKGLFDAIDGVLTLHRRLRSKHSPLRVRLWVAGSFPRTEEERAFRDLQSDPEAGPLMEYFGFIAGAEKATVLQQADIMCFPTYPMESFGLVVVEALAYGMPVVTVQDGAVVEVLPPNYLGTASTRTPEAIADALERMIWTSDFANLRRHFVEHFTVDNYLKRLAASFHRLAADDPADLTEYASYWPEGRRGSMRK